MTAARFNPGDVAAHGSGSGFLYRPHELLVASEDVSLVSPQLDPFQPQMSVVEELDVVRYLLPPDVVIPELIDRLRGVVNNGPTPQVGPNHVLIAQEEEVEEPLLEDGPYSGGLIGPLVPTPPLEIDFADAEPLVGVEVGVVDGPLYHHQLFEQFRSHGKLIVPERQVETGPIGDLNANHATAVLGVLVQKVPRATIRLEVALDVSGVSDELAVASAMLRLRDLAEPANRQVLLLPLGGYSCADMEPVALSAALARLPASTAVIAAAGNAGRDDRPFWPAAHSRVVGVGATDRYGRRAPFSNHSASADVSVLGIGVPTTAWLPPAQDASAVPPKQNLWVRLSGTSLAAARCSAVLAQRMAEQDLDWQTAVKNFQDEPDSATADPVGSSSPSRVRAVPPAEATTVPERDVKQAPPAPEPDAAKSEPDQVLPPAAPSPAPPPRIGEREIQVVGYNADGILEQKDRLGILDDVYTLAAVLAASGTTPPLSVGLFGDWGSGKSFFMRQLRLRIDDLARKSRRAELTKSPTFFCTEVVQIEFNAWHYIDANLWASLVTRIFEGLSQHLTQQKGASEAYQALLGELETARVLLKQAEDRRQAAEASLEQARRTRAELRAERRGGGDRRTVQDFVEQNPELGEAADQLVETLGVDQRDLRLTELREVTEDLRHIGGRLRRGWNGLDRTRGFWTRPRLGAVLAATAVVAVLGLRWVISNNADIKGFVALIGSTLAAFVSVAVSVGRTARQALAAAARVVDKDEQEHERQLAAAQRQVDQAQQQMDQARSEVERVQQLDAGTVYRFIEDRYASSDYRQYLGIVALIQRDFQSLSDRLRPPDGALTKNGQSDLPRVDRIVLYIDDLDRCPSDRVVQVLQAVHLLLAFPLFVVVVGVDSRWLLQSLRKEYEAVLTATDGKDSHSENEAAYWASTPQNYLEKIFQIPYWIRPMEQHGYVDLVRSLFASDAQAQATAGLARHAPVDEAPGESTRAGGAAAAAEPPSPTATSLAPEGSLQTDGSAAPEGPKAARPSSSTESRILFAEPTSRSAPRPDLRPAQAAAPTAATHRVEGVTEADAERDDSQGELGGIGAAPSGREEQRTVSDAGRPGRPAGEEAHAASVLDPDIDLTPARLLIGPDEQAFIEALAPLIPTPRVAKRLVNTYRLLRVSAPDPEAFEGRNQAAQYEAVLLLLAIMTGFPTQAGRLFQDLARSSVDTWPQFVDDLRPVRAVPRQPDAGEPDRGPNPPEFTSRLLGDMRAVEARPWLRLCERLDQVRPHLQPIPLATFRAWIGPVARYSFEAGRVVGEAPQQPAPAGGEASGE